MASGFVTETELEEKRIQRQEEWDKVRKAEDPEEAPEEPYDHRSLFDRLEEQRQKKQQDWEEEHKFKNQFRGLDDDEVDFLDKIDDIRTEAERRRIIEERLEVEEYQRKQNQIKEQEMQERLRHEIKGPDVKRLNRSTGSKSKQQQLLLGVVKRKSSESSQKDEKRLKPSEKDEQKSNEIKTETKILDRNEKDEMNTTETKDEKSNSTGAAPGLGLLGVYGSESSDSESDNS